LSQGGSGTFNRDNSIVIVASNTLQWRHFEAGDADMLNISDTRFAAEPI
jgi:hypothetical protein